MEAAWRHTDTLIFQSRYQEILLLVQDDPLEDLMRVKKLSGVWRGGEMFSVCFCRSLAWMGLLIFVVGGAADE